jgi:hypothetical protein
VTEGSGLNKPSSGEDSLDIEAMVTSPSGPVNEAKELSRSLEGTRDREPVAPSGLVLSDFLGVTCGAP